MSYSYNEFSQVTSIIHKSYSQLYTTYYYFTDTIVKTFNPDNHYEFPNEIELRDSLKVGNLLNYYTSSGTTFKYYYSDIVLGIKGLESVVIQIYPNPTSGIVHLKGINETLNYQIFNMQSRMLANGVVYNNTIDVDIPPGVYLLLLQNEKHFSKQKLIIMN